MQTSAAMLVRMSAKLTKFPDMGGMLRTRVLRNEFAETLSAGRAPRCDGGHSCGKGVSASW